MRREKFQKNHVWRTIIASQLDSVEFTIEKYWIWERRWREREGEREDDSLAIIWFTLCLRFAIVFFGALCKFTENGGPSSVFDC